MVPEVSNIQTAAQQIPTEPYTPENWRFACPYFGRYVNANPQYQLDSTPLRNLAVESSLCRSLSASERSERFTCSSKKQLAKPLFFGRNMRSNGVLERTFSCTIRGNGNGSAASDLKTFDHLPRCRLGNPRQNNMSSQENDFYKGLNP